MTDEVVTRLYRALVEELRRRGHQEGRPLKVSELYQSLVPYRTVRSTLGVELNADYEHALLRLLAGERGLLRLEPEQAREELRREVSAPYPFVGLFRKFSASDVWVQLPEQAPTAEPVSEPVSESESESEPETEATPASAAAPAPEPEAEPEPQPASPRHEQARPVSEPAVRPSGEPAQRAQPPAAVPDAAGERLVAEAEPVRVRGGGGASAAPARVPMTLHQPAPEQPASERLTHAGVACAFCSEDLPSGRRVRFCPHCGGDQRLQPCPRCEAVLEREWRYCISCGHALSAG